MVDPFVGKLAFFRVYSGTLTAGSYVMNSTKQKRERMSRIMMMHANHREEVAYGLSRYDLIARDASQVKEQNK